MVSRFFFLSLLLATLCLLSTGVARAQDGSFEAVDKLDQSLNQDLLQLQALLKEGQSPTEILSQEESRKLLIKAFEVNPLSKIPRNEFEKLFEEKCKTSAFGKHILQSPKIKYFLIEWMSHPTAFGSFLRILEKMDLLKRCSLYSLVLFIILFFLRAKGMKNTEFFLFKITIYLSSYVVFFVGSFFIFWNYFQSELTQTWDIFKSVFFNS